MYTVAKSLPGYSKQL